MAQTRPLPGPTPSQPAPSQQAATAPAAVIRGIVKSGNTPIPGVTVTAINTATRQKTSTWTDVDGSYTLSLPATGSYFLRTQMTGFAPAMRRLEINTPSKEQKMDLELVLASRYQGPMPGEQRGVNANGGFGRHPGMNGNGRFQGLSVMQSEEAGDFQDNKVAPAGMPVPGIAPNTSSESVEVSGNGEGNLSGMSSEEMRQRWQDARDQREGGSYGGPGGGPRGGGPGGGGGPMMIMRGGRGFDINRPHGTVYYTIGESALDASPYSLTGQPGTKPSYSQNRFGAAIGGPLNIPKIYKGGNKTFFFVNYNGTYGDNPYDAFSTVPTLAERSGNFSNTRIANGANAGSRVEIFDPKTRQPFPNNTIPQNMIDPAAAGLLPFIPLPNLPGDVQNFHFITAATNNTNDLNVRVMHSFNGATFRPGRRGGPRNNLIFGLHYHTANTNLTNPFPSVGGNTSTRSIDVPVSYIRTFGKLTNIARVDYNRNRISTLNLYAFSQDITGNLGITGVSTNPFDFGVPNLSFTNFASLNDTNPLLRRDQTFTVSDSMVLNHGNHTLRWGGDFRRIQLNTTTDSNARGSFIFTGLNTAQMVNGVPAPGTGVDFADFLLGLPQQTSAQFGDNSYHFRGNSWDLFVQDEWRIRGNLTFNLGLRYEYVSPYAEINDRIVNLDVAPGFTAVVPVLPNQVGTFTGRYPATLVDPDRNNFAPRVGIAWKPLQKTVVRAGYGINYNTSAYSNIVQQLAFQPPFSFTQTNVQSATTQLTLQNGFPANPPDSVTNNYGVDRHYPLGYVQIWNLDVQQEIAPTLVMNLDYTGTKGTHLDIVEAPNRTATGVRIPGVQPFLFEDSNGSSVANAGTVRVRKRLQHGISIGGSYTFSKSLDNASTIGGGATVVAQNAFDLAAERGLSSFDQRHRFTADYLWELPFGHDKRWLTGSGPLRDILGDWQWSGSWTIASGLPFTPRILGAFSDVNRGTNGTLRPDVTGLPVSISDPTVAEWFNTAAFVAPPPGQFGDARRNSITGPGTRLFNMALTKVIPLKESRVLEFRASASNVFNTPQFTAIDSIVNSPTYGRVVAAGNMRQMQLTGRLRF